MPARPKDGVGRVLLVDDEQALLEGLGLLVRRLGYQVHTASSVRRAWQLLAEHTVDVVVSDERMPGVAGSAFLAELAEREPSVVRIVLSGGGLPVAERAVNTAAAFRFLRKPCSPKDMAKTLEDAMVRRARSHPPTEGVVAPQESAAPPASSGTITRTARGAIELAGLLELLEGRT